MGLEPRGWASQVDQGPTPLGEEPTERPRLKVKSFEIPKRLVFEAWEKVRANKGAPGVDAVSVAGFASEEANNLYKLWNRSVPRMREAKPAFGRRCRSNAVQRDGGRNLGSLALRDQLCERGVPNHCKGRP